MTEQDGEDMVGVVVGRGSRTEKFCERRVAELRNGALYDVASEPAITTLIDRGCERYQGAV